MDRKASPKPTLCRGGCGFYGSAANEGLCSECYKKHVEQQQEAVAQTLSKAMSTVKDKQHQQQQLQHHQQELKKIVDNTGTCTGSGSGGARSKLKINQKNENDNDEENPNAADSSMPSTSQAATAQQQQPNAAEPPTTTQNDPNLDESMAGVAVAGAPNGPPEQEASKEKKNRCAECGKKVGLTGFTCRCGGLFCPIHRYSDKHNCTFNYREMGAEEIRRNNPTVTAEKIRKI